PEHFNRLVAACISRDADRRTERTVREFIEGFEGMKGTAKQKAVLEATGLARTSLSALADDHDLRTDLAGRLLAAIKENTKPVKPASLGVISRDHLERRFQNLGSDMETFDYRKALWEVDGVPRVAEAAFAWCEPAETRRLVTGVNWSPGIVNPFRELGK